MDFTEEECLVDLQLRKKTRLQYPGACSLEFQSISQIIMKALLGWNDNLKRGTKGIIGILEHFGDAVEEQNRTTLHRHLCVWIKDFEKLRRLVFNVNQDVRIKTRKELLLFTER